MSWKAVRHWELRIFVAVFSAVPLAFVAFVWQRTNYHVGLFCLSLLGIAWSSGRFWAGEEYKRELLRIRDELGLKRPEDDIT